MDAIISYIISFLLNGQKQYAELIGYTKNPEEFSRYKIVIIPSDFFSKEIYGTIKSLPTLPLQSINEIPLLFGSPNIEKQGNTIILHADIIAGSFFLLSRYEETISKSRDVHGRFLGKESLPYRGKFLHRPIVDEYGKFLREKLRSAGVDIIEPETKIKDIILTHDLDKLEQYRNIRGFLGGIVRTFLSFNLSGIKQVLKSFFCGIQYDPLYTFPWLFSLNNKVKNAKTIVFFKASKSKIKEDKPSYNLNSKDLQQFIQYCKSNNCEIGLHTSYEKGISPIGIKNEKEQLSKSANCLITSNRHHFLLSKEPQDMNALIEAGITDDYTIGYADVSGFRLGTCKVVNFIDPIKKTVTNLKLHPLAIMECTLDRKQYMGMDYENAFSYCKEIINQVKTHNGELVLLWHNSSVAETDKAYQRKLYSNIIKELEN